MEVVLVNEQRKAEWESFVAENPNAIAWQSYEWKDVLKKHFQFEYHPIAVCDSAKILGVLPLYRMKTMLAKDSLISVPFAVAGGIVSDSEEARDLLIGKAIALSRKYNSCGITLKQYKIMMRGDFQTDDNYYNRELDISRNPDGIIGDFSDRNKQMIALTAKQSLSLEHPSSDLSGFFRLLLRHLHAKGVPCVSKRWIEDLIRSKMYSIALLRSNGQIRAGTMVKEFKKTVSFPFTSLRVGAEQDSRMGYKLYWELIQKFHLKGFEIFHSGRIPNDDMTDDYRLGWGGIKHRYYYQYYPNRAEKTEYATKRGGKRKILERCWKLLPAYVAESIGPMVVKRFP